MVNPIFRQTALEQVSSPDQLDQLLHITRPRAWLALLGLGAVVVAVLFWSFGGSVPVQATGSGILTRSTTGLYGVQAPEPGIITDVPVQIGSTVSAGQPVATLKSSDGRQTTITSPYPGTVLSLSVEAGSVVSAGASIGVVDPTNAPLEAIVFVPAAQGAGIAPGQPVHVQPATARVDVYGNLLGTVESVNKFPARGERIAFLVQNDALAQAIGKSGPVYEVHVAITPDPASADGYKWSSGSRGSGDIDLAGGTLCRADVVLSHQRPSALAFPESNH